jgi:hypothetical protein
LRSAEAQRDGALASLEDCAHWPAGLVRALRVELAPAACGDAIVEPFLERRPLLSRDIEQALVGLALAARLRRLADDAPIPAALDRSAYLAHFETVLRPWVLEQARAIQEVSLSAAALQGYGKAVAAVEAGMADMRFVEVARAVPLPDEMAADSEVRDEYYAELDASLEPRKARGRDAALVGLTEFAALGVLRHDSVVRARALLSQVYGGRRIDALDQLMLPALPRAPRRSLEERLAATLPTFYAETMLQELEPQEPSLLRALLERGIGPSVRAALTTGDLGASERVLFARALFDLGVLYWRASDFRAAAEQARAALLRNPEDRDATELIAALASVLEAGPSNAAQMMLRGPLLPGTLAHVEPLEVLMAGASAYAGMARFNAAHLRSLVPPNPPDPGFWLELATSFSQAADALAEPALKRRALDRAEASNDTARALEP